jgi:hypothetical protein
MEHKAGQRDDDDDEPPPTWKADGERPARKMACVVDQLTKAFSGMGGLDDELGELGDVTGFYSFFASYIFFHTIVYLDRFQGTLGAHDRADLKALIEENKAWRWDMGTRFWNKFVTRIPKQLKKQDISLLTMLRPEFAINSKHSCAKCMGDAAKVTTRDQYKGAQGREKFFAGWNFLLSMAVAGGETYCFLVLSFQYFVMFTMVLFGQYVIPGMIVNQFGRTFMKEQLYSDAIWPTNVTKPSSGGLALSALQSDPSINPSATAMCFASTLNSTNSLDSYASVEKLYSALNEAVSAVTSDGGWVQLTGIGFGLKLTSWGNLFGLFVPERLNAHCDQLTDPANVGQLCPDASKNLEALSDFYHAGDSLVNIVMIARVSMMCAVAFVMVKSWNHINAYVPVFRYMMRMLQYLARVWSHSPLKLSGGVFKGKHSWRLSTTIDSVKPVSDAALVEDQTGRLITLKPLKAGSPVEARALEASLVALANPTSPSERVQADHKKLAKALMENPDAVFEVLKDEVSTSGHFTLQKLVDGERSTTEQLLDGTYEFETTEGGSLQAIVQFKVHGTLEGKTFKSKDFQITIRKAEMTLKSEGELVKGNVIWTNKSKRSCLGSWDDGCFCYPGKFSSGVMFRVSSKTTPRTMPEGKCVFLRKKRRAGATKSKVTEITSDALAQTNWVKIDLVARPGFADLVLWLISFARLFCACFAIFTIAVLGLIGNLFAAIVLPICSFFASHQTQGRIFKILVDALTLAFVLEFHTMLLPTSHQEFAVSVLTYVKEKVQGVTNASKKQHFETWATQLRSALCDRCAFFREGRLVSTKNTVLPLQMAYTFNPTFKPPEKGKSVI